MNGIVDSRTVVNLLPLLVSSDHILSPNRDNIVSFLLVPSQSRSSGRSSSLAFLLWALERKGGQPEKGLQD